MDMPQQPLVSIVLSTYNGATYLEEQLNSLLAQTWKNLEILIADDGSTDDTVHILLQYSEANKQLHFYQNEINLGYVRSFEKLISKAKGELIALCDQDDFWLPDKIEKLVIQRDNFPLIYCDSALVDEELKSLGKNLSDVKNLATYTSCLVFATDNCIAGHATLFTKELYDRSIPFPTFLPHDFWLAFMATLYGGVKYLPEPLVKYRNHRSNVIGAVNVYGKKETKEEKRIKKQQLKDWARERVENFFHTCPDHFKREKIVLRKLHRSYKSFFFINNLERMVIFFGNVDTLLAIKKRPLVRKWLYCFKMFTRLR